MVQISGKYQNERNENLDQYFKDMGIPYIPRKMILASTPVVEFLVDEDGQWTMTTSTLLRTTVQKFKLNEEYDEQMPGGPLLKSTTSQEGEDNLTTVSTAPDGTKATRIFEFTETQMILTMKHDKSSVEAKRYYKRL